MKKLQINRSINLSEELLKQCATCPLLMDMYALYASIKLHRRDSRYRFKSLKDLIQQLGIGYSKFKSMQKHEMFDELFRMTGNTFVARRCKYDKIQVSLGCGKVKLPPKRLLIKVYKNEVLNYEKVADKIREARFVNLVRNKEAGLYSGKPVTPTSLKKKVDSYAGLIDSTISNENIASFLGVGLTKAKQIAAMAIKDKLVRKFENIKEIAQVDNPAAFIEANSCMCPIGKLIPCGHFVLWQIPNTWKLAKKGSRNRWYYGEKHLVQHEKRKPVRKNDYGFFMKDNKDILRFLNATEVVSDDGEILGIQRIPTKEELAREIAINMAMEEHKELWEGYDPRVRYKIIRTYYKAVLAEEKRKNFFSYIEHLKKADSKVKKWDDEKLAETTKQMEYAKACCEEAETTIESIGTRIDRRLKYYRINLDYKASFDFVRELYSELAGKLTKSVWAVNENVWTLYQSEKYKEELDKLDVNDRRIFEKPKLPDLEEIDFYEEFFKNASLDEIVNFVSQTRNVDVIDEKGIRDIISKGISFCGSEYYDKIILESINAKGKENMAGQDIKDMFKDIPFYNDPSFDSKINSNVGSFNVEVKCTEDNNVNESIMDNLSNDVNDIIDDECLYEDYIGINNYDKMDMIDVYPLESSPILPV